MDNTENLDVTESQQSINPEPEPAVEEEPMLPQSKVNEIVGRAKQAAYEKAKREAMQELEANAQAQLEAQRPEQQMAGQPAYDIDAMTQQIRERLIREAEEQRQREESERYALEMNRIANDYYTKMGKGSELYDDFAEVTKDLNPASFKHLVILAADMDNTAEIMYELSQNPIKMLEIDTLAERDPNLAKRELVRLNKSIDANREALSNNRAASEPLSRMKPSSAASADGGAMSLRDFKAKYRT